MHSPSPTLGEHNEEVLSEVGLTSDELASLRDSGVLGSASPAWNEPTGSPTCGRHMEGATDPLSRFVSSLKGRALGTKKGGSTDIP